jgi:transmembrane sensor
MRGVNGHRTFLQPEERLTIGSGGIGHLDRPDIEQAIAWHFGQAIFDATPLRDALKEMQRYDRRKVEIAESVSGNELISGRYKTGNIEAFANSVGVLLNLRVNVTPDKIVMRFPDSSTPRSAPTPSALHNAERQSLAQGS